MKILKYYYPNPNKPIEITDKKIYNLFYNKFIFVFEPLTVEEEKLLLWIVNKEFHPTVEYHSSYLAIEIPPSLLGILYLQITDNEDLLEKFLFLKINENLIPVNKGNNIIANDLEDNPDLILTHVLLMLAHTVLVRFNSIVAPKKIKFSPFNLFFNATFWENIKKYVINKESSSEET